MSHKKFCKRCEFFSLIFLFKQSSKHRDIKMHFFKYVNFASYGCETSHNSIIIQMLQYWVYEELEDEKGTAEAQNNTYFPTRIVHQLNSNHLSY